MPRCAFCNKDTELESRPVGNSFSTRLIHSETGQVLCMKDPAKGFPEMKYREVDGNVYRVRNGKLGEFVGKLEDIADIFLLYQEAEEKT